MNFNKTALGINVRYFRQRVGITQEDLGAPYYKKSWMSKLENGKPPSDIDHRILEIFADRLGTTVDILLNQDEELIGKMDELESLIRARILNEDTAGLADSLISITSERYGPRDQVSALFKRGNIEYYSRYYEKALVFYENAVAIARAWSDFLYLHAALQNVAYVYIALNDYENAEIVMTRELPSIDDWKMTAKSQSIIAQLYCLQEKWSRAEPIAKAVVDLPDAPEIAASKMLCYQYLGGINLNLFEFSGNKSDLFLQAAYEYSSQALEMARERNHQTIEIYSLKIISECHFLKGENGSAVSHIAQAMSVSVGKAANERVELSLIRAMCEVEDERTFLHVVTIYDELETLAVAPRTLAKHALRLSRMASKFNLITHVIHFYEKAIQYQNNIVR